MRALIIASFFLLLTGCAQHRLVVKQPNPGTQGGEVKSAAIGWGAIEKRSIAVCDTNIIDEVRVKQTVGQSLLTVLTLGFYVPTTIEYVCGNVPSSVGSTTN